MAASVGAGQGYPRAVPEDLHDPHQQPSPDPRRASATAGPPGPVRAAVERASMPALRRLAGLPAWLPFVTMLALILLGSFFGGPVGATAVAVAALVIGWLLYLSWPHLRSTERLMRLAVLLLVVAIAITRLAPQ